MQSKNKPAPTKLEAEHIQRIKSQPCAVCDATGPSEAHEMEQGLWWTSIALCGVCHSDEEYGIHGRQIALHGHHMTVMDALNRTIGRAFGVSVDKPERLAKQFKPSSKIIPRRGFV